MSLLAPLAMVLGFTLLVIVLTIGIWLRANGTCYAPECAHADKEAAEEHIRRIRVLRDLPRVRVSLAYDERWYASNKGGTAFWPGKIVSL